MATKTDTERAAFEAWYREKYESMLYCESQWDAWQARSALQSQDRMDAERLQYLLRRVCMYQTASYGCKFEILNLPPHFGDCEPDPIPPFLAAIDHARRIES